MQVENGFDYVVNQLKVANPKVGIIYQDDGYGADGLQGYKESLGCYSSLDNVAEAPFPPSDINDFVSQVSAMQRAGAQYVWVTATPQAAAGIVGTGAALHYFPHWMFQSPAWANGLLQVSAAFSGLLEQTVWVVTQGATWGDTTVPGMAQMLQDIQKYSPSQGPDGCFEFGYAEAQVTGAILKKAYANHDLSRAGLYNAFNSLGTVDLGGLIGQTVTYGSQPNQRVPTRDSAVYGIDPTVQGDVKNLSGDFTGSCALASQF